MTYEFNAEDSASIDFPNPFKIENVFLLLSSAVLIYGGISVLMQGRTYFQNHQDKIAGVTILVSFALFGTAIKFLIQALSQIRFYLSRKYPIGLANELPVGMYGEGVGADYVMETLRQRAIEFPEPQGPLNGILYSLIKPLVTSPPPIQAAAVQHFHSVIAMTAILISMTATYLFVSGTEYEGVMSWAYLPMTGLSLVTPFMQAKGDDASASIETGSANAMLWKLLSLVVFVLIAPVVIARFVPAYPIPPMWIAPLLLLVGSMASSILFLISLLHQIDNVQRTSVSCEQTTISMNCHPSQLWPQVSRDFQNSWVRGIPNRSYTNVPPVTDDGDRGAFQGHLLEETQPTSSNTLDFASLKEAMSLKYVRYLMLLSAWGMALSIATASLATHFAPLFLSMERMEISRAILIVAALGIVTVLSFRIGHLLWSRMYFKSRLIWIYIDGTFQSGDVRIGNQFTGNAQSRATLTRVEDATLRVWVTDIVSVAFGKEAKRFIMAMAPADGYAKSLADGLKEFALNQSSIAIPTSNNDFIKARAIGLLDAAVTSQNTQMLETKTSSRVLFKGGKQVQEQIVQGIVKYFDAEKQFGFIAGDDGVDRFFNAKSIQGNAVKTGDRVRFLAISHIRGPRALKISAC